MNSAPRWGTRVIPRRPCCAFACSVPWIRQRRPTPWGNPFVVGPRRDAARAVEMYRLMLAGYFELTAAPDFGVQRAARRHVLDHIEGLRGRNLGCWCRAGHPCHADVLLEIANA